MLKSNLVSGSYFFHSLNAFIDLMDGFSFCGGRHGKLVGCSSLGLGGKNRKKGNEYSFHALFMLLTAGG